MYVVCVLCDVGRRHAVAFRAERRRRHVFVFLGVCIIRTSACVRVCAVLCVCTFMCVRARYHQLLSSQVASPCRSYVSCVAVSNSSHAASSCRRACGRTTMKAFEP